MEAKKQFVSWFWKWFLNNKFIVVMAGILLFLLNILLLKVLTPIFEPVGQFFTIVGLPVVMAGILYYMLNPIVEWLEKRRVPRIVSIIGLFLVIVALVIWGSVILVPKMQEQTMSFIKNWPSYWQTIQDIFNKTLKMQIFTQFRDQIEALGTDFFKSLSTMLKSVSTSTVQSLGSVFGVIANVLIALVTMPFILFYLLKDGKKLPDYMVTFIPTKMRQPIMAVLADINRQVSQYIRGQVTVAIAVAIMFIIGFSLVGLDYSVTLGIAAGALNLVPYLGSFLAMIPVLILAVVAGPIMIIKVLVIFAVEQFIEGRLISPLVLGSQMEMHPITIIFVLLTSGKLFGVTGVILGIPGYAAIKVILSHLFNWYQTHSGLYEPLTEARTEAVELDVQEQEKRTK